MVKSMKERLAEKRAAAADRTAATPDESRPNAATCKDCGSRIQSGTYCRNCEAMRSKFSIERSKPEPPKEKTMSTSIATNHVNDVANTEITELTPERIKAIRTKHGMTQGEFAKQLGVSSASIGFWENGRFRPSIDSVIHSLLELEAMEPATAQEPTANEGPELDPDQEALEPASDDPEIVRAFTLSEDDWNALVERTGRIATLSETLGDRIDELAFEKEFPTANVNPEIRDNLDAFRLLVRTFGIETADRVVDLLRG